MKISTSLSDLNLYAIANVLIFQKESETDEMKKLPLYIPFAFYLLLLLASCSSHEMSEVQDQNHEELKHIAWDFVVAKGWDKQASETWQNATVTKRIVDQNVEFIASDFVGKEVYAISFEDQPNTVVSTPRILIDPHTKAVIGYLPGE